MKTQQDRIPSGWGDVEEPPRRLLAYACDQVVAFVADQTGAIATIFALALPMMVGLTGLSIDVGMWYQQSAQLQLGADAAAIAGARELGAGQPGKVTAAAQTSAALNGFTSAGGTTVLTSVAGSVVTATITAAAPLYFARLFLPNPVNLQAIASASFISTPVCFMALRSTGSSVVASGNAALVANGCAIQVNSTGTPDMVGSGNASFSASSICVAGTYGSGTYTPTPQTHCAVHPDPLAALPAPTVGACNYTNFSVSHTPAPLSPGVYCGGISASGQAALTLNPGIYILKNGGLRLSGQVSVTGSGVMLFLTGNGSGIAMSGTSSVQLSAPTSGTYAGILIYGDRSQTNGSAAFSGGNNNSYEGTVYLPTMSVALSGNGTGTISTPWSAFIADTFTMSGNGNFTINSNYQSSLVPLPSQLVRTVVHLSS
jgi:Flp pilus assembly protein TadG